MPVFFDCIEDDTLRSLAELRAHIEAFDLGPDFYGKLPPCRHDDYETSETLSFHSEFIPIKLKRRTKKEREKYFNEIYDTSKLAREFFRIIKKINQEEL